MNISRHAQTRYAERIMTKDDEADVNLFISNHIQKITEDITKMIKYGDLLYEGRSIKQEWNKSVVQIYMRDNWIVVVDKDKQNVITLFTIDLGVGEEMNQLYLSKLREQLDAAKVVCKQKCDEIELQKQTYQSLIENNEDVIAENNRINKSLEEQNEMYRGLIKAEETNKELAEKEIRRIVGVLTSKSIF